MLTFEQQVTELNNLAHDWAVQTNRNVKGEYTSGEYVEWQLRRIFGPAHWSFTILAGPEIVRLSETEAYGQVTGRLAVTFAGGHQATQDAVGVWPLRATRAGKGGTLEHTAAERFETVLKAACTDALKAAAERLGSCFRPLSDLTLRHHIKRELHRQNNTPPPPDQARAELYDEPAPEQAPAGNRGRDPVPASNGLSQNQARQQFYALSGPAVAAGDIDFNVVNSLTAQARTDGWLEPLAKLQEYLAQ